MSKDNEVRQIDAEIALHDVMHIICELVTLKDLLNIAKVCRSWREAALRENSRRFSVQRLFLPYETNNLASILDVHPFASLLVYDYTTYEKSLMSSYFSCLEYVNGMLAKKMLEKFKKQLPNTVIVLGVDEHHTYTIVAEHLEPMDRLERKVSGVPRRNWEHKRNILGVFLPSMRRRIRVHVASHWYTYGPEGHPDRKELVDRLAGELGLNDCEPYPKSTIIQLAVVGGTDHSLIGEIGKRAQENGKEITWSSIFGAKLMVSNCDSESPRASPTTTAFIRISGPGVESWNTFIYLLVGRDEILRKLEELNARVVRKRNNLGFFYVPNCRRQCCHKYHPCGDSALMKHTLSRVFHDIRFTGFFMHSKVFNRMESGHPRRFFKNRFNENDEKSFNKDFLDKLADYASILIISYD